MSILNNCFPLKRSDLFCKYYPEIDRFCVSKDKSLNTLDYVINSKYFRAFEYLRYIPGPDVGLLETDLYIQHFPYECCFEITNICNLKCPICISDSKVEHGSILSSTRFFNIVKKYRSPRITLTGGEPTLHPDILNLVFISSKMANRVVLSTNGTNLDIIDSILPKVRNLILAVSLHGPEDIHDNYVGIEGAFSKAIKCVHNAISHRIPVHVYSVISKETLFSLSRLCDILKHYDIDEHRLFLVKPEGRIQGIPVVLDDLLLMVKYLSLPYKISLKQKDQPFIFVDVSGKENLRHVRQY